MDQHLLNRVSLCVNQGNFPEAINLLISAKEAHANDAQYWEITALTHGMSGDNEECKNACQVAIQLNPENIATFINLGVAQQNLGLLDDAEKTLKSALSMDDSHPQIQNNLGAIYILKSEYIKRSHI